MPNSKLKYDLELTTSNVDKVLSQLKATINSVSTNIKINISASSNDATKSVDNIRKSIDVAKKNIESTKIDVASAINTSGVDAKAKSLSLSLITGLRNEIAGAKIDISRGITVDATKLSSIKSQINEALSGGKISNTAGATLLNQLQSVASRSSLIGKDIGNNVNNGVNSSKSDAGITFGKLIGANIIAGLGLDFIKSTINKAISFVPDAIDTFKTSQQASISLSVVSKSFKIDPTQAAAAVKTLVSQLNLSETTVQNSLQNLIKSGLSIGQSAELLKRYKNEAITGKSANIGLNQAVENLSFAFQTQNSTLGNLSGINENFSNIQEKGLGIIKNEATLRGVLLSSLSEEDAKKKQGLKTSELLKNTLTEEQTVRLKGILTSGKSIGQLDDEEKKLVSLIGTINLTNQTKGSAEQFNGTLIDSEAKLDTAYQNLQKTVGGALAPILGSFYKNIIIPLTGATEELFKKSSIGDGLVAIFEKLGKVLTQDNIVAAVERITKVFDDLIKRVSESAALQTTLTVVFGAIAQIADVVLKLVELLVQNQTLFDGIVLIVVTLGAIFGSLTIITGIISLVTAITPLIILITTIISVISSVITLIGAGGLSTLLPFLAQGFSVIGGAILTFLAPLLTVPVIIALVIGVVVLLYLAFQSNFLGIGDIVRSIGGIIQAGLDLAKGIFDTFLLFIQNKPNEAFAKLISTVNNFIKNFTDSFNKLPDGIKNAINGAIDFIRNSDIFKGIVDQARRLKDNLPFGLGNLLSFGTGVRNLKEDTIANVGEAGREIVKLPNGVSFIVDKPSVLPLPKGTDVYNNSETESLFRRQNQSVGNISTNNNNQSFDNSRNQNISIYTTDNASRRTRQQYRLSSI